MIFDFVHKMKSTNKEQALAIDLLYRILDDEYTSHYGFDYQPPANVPHIVKKYFEFDDFNNEIDFDIVKQSVINYVCSVLEVAVDPKL